MSPPPQHLNTATPRSRTQFARFWQQLHHFRHRIAKDNPRTPTSAGLQVDEVAPVDCVPQPATGDAPCPARASRRAGRATPRVSSAPKAHRRFPAPSPRSPRQTRRPPALGPRIVRGRGDDRADPFANDDPRRPTPASLPVDEVASVGAVPHRRLVLRHDPKAVTIARNTGRI
jgi:hypothetical protein